MTLDLKAEFAKWPDWIARDFVNDSTRAIRKERLEDFERRGNTMSAEGLNAAAGIVLESQGQRAEIKAARLPGSRESWAVSALDAISKWPPGKSNLAVSTDCQFMRALALRGLEKVRSLMPDEYSPEERADFIAGLRQADDILDRVLRFYGWENEHSLTSPGVEQLFADIRCFGMSHARLTETPALVAPVCNCGSDPNLVEDVYGDGSGNRYGKDCPLHAGLARFLEHRNAAAALENWEIACESNRGQLVAVSETLELVRTERDRLQSDLQVATEELAARRVPWRAAIRLTGITLAAAVVGGVVWRVFAIVAGF